MKKSNKILYLLIFTLILLSGLIFYKSKQNVYISYTNSFGPVIEGNSITEYGRKNLITNFIIENNTNKNINIIVDLHILSDKYTVSQNEKLNIGLVKRKTTKSVEEKTEIPSIPYENQDFEDILDRLHYIRNPNYLDNPINFDNLKYTIKVKDLKGNDVKFSLIYN